MEHLSDLEIIQLILSGNTAQFELIIRKYNSALYKAGRAYGYNHQDTEDIMQETYIRAYQGLSGFQNRSTFKTWIIRIMLNQCYHKAQKHSFKKEILTDEITNTKSVAMFPTTNHSDTNKSVLTRELSHVIESAVQKLPEDYKMTFTLRELAGLNVSETAQVMNTTTSNVKVRLNRAKLMLRKEVEKLYSVQDIYEFNLIYCDKIMDAVMKKIFKLNTN